MIVNPIWFYLMGVCDNLSCFLLAISIVLFIFSFGLVVAWFCTGDFDIPENVKTIKKMFIINGIVFLLGTIIPSKETCYQMMVASLVTKENIEMTAEAGKEAVDYIIDSIDKLLDEQEED